MEIKKYQHIEYAEIDGKLFRVMGEFKFPMKDLQDEIKKDRKAIARIKRHGPTPYPFPRDYHTLDNWEDDIYLPNGVYPPTGRNPEEPEEHP